MPRLTDRLAELERAALPAVLPALVLFARDGMTPEQQIEYDEAKAAGRIVLVVTCVDASRPDPTDLERAGSKQ